MSYLLGFVCCGCIHGLDTLTAALRLDACGYFGTGPRSSNILHMYSANLIVKPLAVEAKANTRTESAKNLNRRQKKKEAAERVGEELIKACVDLNIDEISTYDRNGLARGERMQALEIAIALHGFLPR